MTLVNDQAVAVPEPTSLVAVHDQCAMVEAWAAGCDSVPLLQDAANKLAAIDEYLCRTTIEGRGRVAKSMRLLEQRIGHVIGAASRDHDRRRGAKSTQADVGLSKDQRSDFRKMAAHPDIVEKVAAASTDEKPATRKAVLAAIREHEDRQRAEAKEREAARLLAATEVYEKRIVALTAEAPDLAKRVTDERSLLDAESTLRERREEDVCRFRRHVHNAQSAASAWAYLVSLAAGRAWRQDDVLAELNPTDRQLIDEAIEIIRKGTA